MIGTLIFEGLKDALPLIEKAAPRIGKLFSGNHSIAASIALPLLKREFTNTDDLSGLARAITEHPNAESILKAIDDAFGDQLASITGDLSHLKNFEMSLKLEWKDGQNNDN